MPPYRQLPLLDPFTALLGPAEPCFRCGHTDDHVDARRGCDACNLVGGPCDACLCCRNNYDDPEHHHSPYCYGNDPEGA